MNLAIKLKFQECSSLAGKRLEMLELIIHLKNICNEFSLLTFFPKHKHNSVYDFDLVLFEYNISFTFLNFHSLKAFLKIAYFVSECTKRERILQ